MESISGHKFGWDQYTNQNIKICIKGNN